MNTRLLLTAAFAVAANLMASAAFADVTLSYLIDDGADTHAVADALAEAFTKKNPDIHIDIEVRPGGSDGDNLIKTRLATGEMSDMFMYNSGSLLKALKPERTLLNLSDLPAMERIEDKFKQAVTGADGGIYGVPLNTAMGGGILYNIDVYKKLGLKVPKTWAEFMDNNKAIKAAGIVPVAQTYGDPWTSQMIVLSDYFNIQAANPGWDVEFTNNKAKFATTPAARRSFEKLEELYKAGYLNEDFGAAKFDEGIAMVVDGTAAHYPMLTFVNGNIKQNFPDKINSVGFFAQPGDSPDKNGLTVWMTGGIYIPKTTEHPEEAKKFLDFVASVEGCNIQTETSAVQGPYFVKGCTLPTNVPRIVSDMLPYFEKDSMNSPALEFLSPVKGPALQQFTVEVGSGIRSAADAAALYDLDVEKQAKQLGLPNW